MVSLAAWPSEQITPVGRGEQMAGGTALPDISDQKMLRSVSSAARRDAMLWYTIAAWVRNARAAPGPAAR